MIICNKCGTKNLFDGATICKKCHTPLHKKTDNAETPIEQQKQVPHSLEQTDENVFSGEKNKKLVQQTDKPADEKIMVGKSLSSEDHAENQKSSIDDEFDIKEVESDSGPMFINSNSSEEETGLIKETSRDSEQDLITPEPIEKELTLYRDDELHVVMEDTDEGPAITLTDIAGNEVSSGLKPLIPTGESETDKAPPEISKEELEMDKTEEANVTQKIIINPIIEKKSIEPEPTKETLTSREPSQDTSKPVEKAPEEKQKSVEKTKNDIKKDKAVKLTTQSRKSEFLTKPRGVAYISGNTIKLIGGIKAAVGDEISIGDKVVELKEKPVNRIPLLAGIGGGILLLFLLLIIFTTGNGPNKGQIVGILKNPENGELVVGATVTIKELGKSTRTNNAGFFIFDLIPADIYTVEAKVPYPFEDEEIGILSERISVIKNRTSTVSFSIPEYGTPSTKKLVSQDYSQPQTSKEIQTPPVKKYGFLKVSLSPSKSKVYLDGEYIGKGSQTFKVPVGKHNITVKYKGYKNLTKKVNIKYDQISSSSFKLKKQKTAQKTAEKSDEELATELEEAGQYSKALVKYNKILQKDENNVEALMGSARCYSAKGDKDKALSAYLKAARIAGDQNDKPTQLGALSGVLDINPNYLTARYTRGSIFLNQGEYYRAAQDFSKVIEIDPRNLNAHYKLGEAYFKGQNYPAAIQIYQQTQNLNFADAKPYAYIAKAYLAMDDTKNAKKYYKKFEKNADLATKNRFESDPEWQKVKQALEK